MVEGVLCTPIWWFVLYPSLINERFYLSFKKKKKRGRSLLKAIEKWF
jgi:hypothetical protein